MIEQTVIIQCEHGLHARMASAISQLACKSLSQIVIIKNSILCDARNMVGIMLMGTAKGDEVIIRADGPDQAAVLEEIATFIANAID